MSMQKNKKTTRGLIVENIEKSLGKSRYDSVLLCAVLAENFSKIHDDVLNQKPNYYVDAVDLIEKCEIPSEDLDLLLKEKIAERLNLKVRENVLTEEDDFVSSLIKEVSDIDVTVETDLLNSVKKKLSSFSESAASSQESSYDSDSIAASDDDNSFDSADKDDDSDLDNF